MTESEPTTLLPTELELVAPFELAPLLAYFGSRVFALRNSVDGSDRTVWLELTSEPHDLDVSIKHWIRIVDAMPADLRAIWNACTDRCLNTGIQSGFRPHASHFSISPDAVSGAARISVRLVFSVYSPDLSELPPVSAETT